MEGIDLSVCLGARFRRLSRVVSRSYNEVLRPFDVKISQVNILFAVAMNPNVRQSEIGTYLRLERSTLSREVRQLVQDGLVVSVFAEGSRSPNLQLTVKGKKLVSEIESAWKVIQCNLEEAIGENSMKEFARLERKLLSV